jgi:hypothetical protein
MIDFLKIEGTRLGVFDPDADAIIDRVEAAGSFSYSDYQKTLLDTFVKNIKVLTGGAFNKTTGQAEGGTLPSLWIDPDLSVDLNTGASTDIYNLTASGGDGTLTNGQVSNSVAKNDLFRRFVFTQGAGRLIDMNYQPDTAQPITVVSVQTFNSTSGNSSLISGTVTGAFEVRRGTSSIQLIKSATAVLGSATTSVTANTQSVRAVRWDGSSSFSFFKDGVTDGSGTSAQTFAASNVRIGARAGGADPIAPAGATDSYIRTLLIFQESLTDNQIIDISNYFKNQN